tara:strand:- start:1401 stop:2366 length:966 start_codon:yes stop_codon:yes gene_type:complete
MKYNKPILIVGGEPNSVFLEIYIKTLKKKKIKSPIILISSEKIIKKQLKKLKFEMRIKKLNYKNFFKEKLDNKSINLINIDFDQKKAFEKISKKSNLFIKKSFQTAFKILKSGITNKFINGPISKKYFLNNKYLGITEYISKHFKVKESCMLIYNKEFSVCPLTTHLPLKYVAKKINKKLIINKVQLINNFYKQNFGFNPRIAVLGLNPHCESVDTFNEDQRIIKPVVKYLSKKYNISGPFSADTIFIKKIRTNFDVVIGMYHDQVLTPIKTLFEYDAINITLGLPFIRISPDHGPNEKMLGKNLSNPLSLIRAINFLDKN